MSVGRKESGVTQIVVILMWTTNLLVLLALLVIAAVAAGLEVRSPYFVLIFGVDEVAALGLDPALTDSGLLQGAASQVEGGAADLSGTGASPTATQGLGGEAGNSSTVLPTNPSSQAPATATADGGASLELGLDLGDQGNLGLGLDLDDGLGLDAELNLTPSELIEDIGDSVEDITDDTGDIVEALVDDVEDLVDDLLNGLGLP